MTGLILMVRPVSLMVATQVAGPSVLSGITQAAHLIAIHTSGQLTLLLHRLQVVLAMLQQVSLVRKAIKNYGGIFALKQAVAMASALVLLMARLHNKTEQTMAIV